MLAKTQYVLHKKVAAGGIETGTMQVELSPSLYTKEDTVFLPGDPNR